MKKGMFIKVFVLVILMLSFAVPASASSSEELQNEYAQDLVKLKLLKGYPDGSLKLNDNIKRSEFITFIVRMLGYENSEEANSVKVSFNDLDKSYWAYNNIRIALKYKLISGYPDNTVGPEKNVTYAEALTVILRVLGYEKTLTGSWPESVISKSKQIGVSSNVDLPANRQITRGEMAVLVHNSLSVNFGK